MSDQMIAVDLFAGAGGLSEGLHRAGYRTAFAADFDEQAVGTYRHNHPDVQAKVADVAGLTARDVLDGSELGHGDIDLLAGGPPCQGFSLAGRRLPNDPKNRLFVQFLRLAQELQPKAILMENVPGIQSMQRGLVVDAIENTVREMGYSVKTGVLNAAEFGVPQSRKRFIMIALRDGSTPSLPTPTHTGGAITDEVALFDDLLPTPSVRDALSDLPTFGQGQGGEVLEHPGGYYNQFQKDRQGTRHPGSLFNHRATRHSERIVARYELIPPGRDNGAVPEEHRTKKINVFRLDPDAPARTVTCNFRTDLIHPWIPRGLTVREAARLQTFDDDYQFFGNLTRKAKWVTQDDQVGNAVPPLLAEALGRHIRSLLVRGGSLRKHSEPSPPPSGG